MATLLADDACLGVLYEKQVRTLAPHCTKGKPVLSRALQRRTKSGFSKEFSA